MPADTVRQEQRWRQLQRRTPSPTFYSEQRRQEYNVDELAQQQLEGMRQSYEAEAKQQLEQQAAEEEQKARQQFEEQLSVERERIRQQREQELEQYFEQQIAEEEQSARQQFEEQLAAERERAIAIGAPEEVVAEWEKEQRMQFEACVSEWRSQARSQAKSQARLQTEQELMEWERTQREQFEADISGWRSQVQPQIQQAAAEYAQQRLAGETRLALLTTAGIGAFAVAPITAAIGAATSIGVSQAVKGIMEQQWLTPEEAVATAALGAASAVVVGKIMEHIVAPKAQQWLTQRYIEKHSTGGFSKALEPWEGKLGFQKAAEAFEVPVEKWAGWQEKLVMKLTGAKPYLATGEVSVPTFEKPIVAEGGKVVGYYPVDVGVQLMMEAWNLTAVPKTSGVMITKTAEVITPYTINWSALIGKMPIEFAVGLRGYKAEEEYIPKTQTPTRTEELGFQKIKYHSPYSGKYAFVKGSTPTIQDLISEQKLLPFTTQTQVTRMGIHPYTPFAAETSMHSAVAGGAAAALTAGLTGLTADSIFKPTRLQFEQKRFEPTLKPFTFATITPFESEEEKTKEKTKAGYAVAPFQSEQLETVQIQTQMQTLTPTRPPLHINEPHKKKKKKEKKKEKEKLELLQFVGWYRWDYPTTTAKTVLEKVAGVKIHEKKRKRRT